MARTKKEAALTPEERLQAALVPDWEWPYKLPRNWCWTTIKNVATVVTGGTPAKNNPAYYGGKFPFFKPADLDVGRHVSEASEYLSDLGKSVSRVIPAQSTAVCCIGSIGKCGFLEVEGATNQQINSAIPYFDALYQYFYMNTEFFLNQLRGSASATTIAIVNKTKMESCYYPLAPLAEQQRIVDRIESLFAKLDEAKEKAQAVLDSFETRKAAILHKAFTGELTAKWREEHGVGMESWEQCSLSDVCTVNPKKADTKDLPDELEVSFFPMPALSEIYGEITDPQTRLLKEVRSGFTNFSEGDVVFAKITPCMENGKSAVVGKLVNDIGYGTTEFFVLRCSDRLYNRFLYHLVRDKLFRDKAKAVMAGAVGQQRVPKRYLETYKLNLPKFNEQREIVRILDGSFAKEQQTKEAAEAVLDQIDLMKKSILARAFRGELGTNDPSEESAVKLLRQVIEQEDGDVIRPKAKAKRIAIPAEIKPLLSGANEEAIVKLLLKAAPQSVSTQTVMSISKKKFELMDALRNLEKKQLVSKSDSGEYSLVR